MFQSPKTLKEIVLSHNNRRPLVQIGVKPFGPGTPPTLHTAILTNGIYRKELHRI